MQQQSLYDEDNDEIDYNLGQFQYSDDQDYQWIEQPQSQHSINTQIETINSSNNDMKCNLTIQGSQFSDYTNDDVKIKNLYKKDQKMSAKSNSRGPYKPRKMKKTNPDRKINRPRTHQFLDEDLCARAYELFKQNLPFQVMKQRLGISHRSMKKLQAQYELYGKLIPTKGNSLNPRQSQNKQSEYSQVTEILRNLISKNCNITLRHMQKALKENNIIKSRSTIHAYLERMRYSRKKLQKIPLERNSLNKVIYRAEYCKMIQQIPLNKQVFLDQTIFGLQTTGHYGWAPKGEQPKVFIPASRRKHITLLAAVSIRGFEATKIIKGPVTSKHVCQFLQHYLDHLEADEILIMDNARMHHAAVVKEKIKELDRNVRYIPAYTPQLNPIENIFSEIKCQYVKLKEDQDLKSHEMIKLIEDAIKAMRSKEFSKYYQHYEQWLKKGVAGELFI